jgi:hypothetical protein
MKPLILLAILSALWIAVLCVSRFCSQEPRDPLYAGKPLSYWLSKSNHSVEPTELTSEAIEAVVHVGTNSVAFLLHEFENGEPHCFASLVPDELFAGKIRIRPRQDFTRTTRAMRALELLGPKLSPHLPRLACNVNDPIRGVPTLYLIRTCGSNGIPYFVLGLSSKYHEVIQFSVRYLGERKSEAQFAIPRIVQLTTHVDKRVRLASILALGNIPNAAKQHLDTLYNALYDSELSVQCAAVSVLSTLEGDAKPAIPGCE